MILGKCQVIPLARKPAFVVEIVSSSLNTWSILLSSFQKNQQTSGHYPYMEMLWRYITVRIWKIYKILLIKENHHPFTNTSVIKKYEI